MRVYARKKNKHLCSFPKAFWHFSSIAQNFYTTICIFINYNYTQKQDAVKDLCTRADTHNVR